jgi:ParB-like nuclease domain/DNA methylase
VSKRNPSMTKNEPAAEWVDRSALKPWGKNPRKNDEAVGAVVESIRRFGFGAPILARRADGEVIAGHTRLKAAEALGLDRVPVRYLDLDPAEAHLLALADNKLNEKAEWDNAAVASVLSDYGLEDAALAGWDSAELDKIAAELAPEPTDVDAEPQVSKAEELRVKWGVETGQLWKLGEHLILCGDSTKAEAVARMSAGCTALVYDPEWDAMPAVAPLASTLAFCDGQRAADVIRLLGAPAWVFAWDCVSSWYTPSRPLRRMKLCFWYGELATYNPDGAHYGDAGEEREVFNSRGSYTFKPDPRGKHLSDVFSTPITKLHAESEHAHSKPTDWIRLLLGNCTSGDVYDPFSGSGTTLIACEQLGRRCRAIEISPAYVAVAIQRWADATGGTPERL